MRWTVYCRVIDNFGDIGFAWRLCADLAGRGETVRLVVDDASALAWLAPEGCIGVTVATPSDPGGAAPDIAVETFGCGLPEPALRDWAQAAAPPLLINLEHLSAEAYVERSHGLASPPARGQIRQHTEWFYFPGFSERTGGLLREPWLAGLARRAHSGHRRQVTAFSYRNPAFESLLDALTDRPTTVLCAPGVPTEQGTAWRETHAGGGALGVIAAPYRSQRAWDEQLHASDLNLVRGEDSLVRAIWAARPFLWQIYPQADGAHVGKLEAFLTLFLRDADPALAADLRAAFHAWNGVGRSGLVLPEPRLWGAHCERFAAALRAQVDLTTQLIGFARSRR